MIKIVSIMITGTFLITYCYFLPRLLLRRDIKSLELLTTEIMLQNMACIFSSNIFSSTVMQFILLYKEIVMWGAILIYSAMQSKLKIKKNIIPAIIAVIIIGCYFLVGNSTLMAKLVCFRQILTPFVLVLYGRILKLSEEDIKSYIKFIVKWGIFQSIFGLFERFVLGDNFWKTIEIGNYMNNKGFAQWLYGNGLPGNFYSADLFGTFGLVRRMAGFVADPLLTAHFLAFCIIILIFMNPFKTNVKRYLAIILMCASLVFTLSKGAILVVGIAFLYKIYTKNKVCAIFASLIPVLILTYIIRGDVFYTLSAHMGGLTAGFNIFKLVGSGLGTAGNYANLYGDAASEVAESYMGALLAQTGIIGLSVFAFTFIYWSKFMLKKNSNRIGYLVFAFVIAVMVEGFMAESAINFIGSGVAFIIFGVLISNTALQHTSR